MSQSRSRVVVFLAALGFAAAAVSPRGVADEPVRGVFEPKAKALLNEVIGAYKALPAYADQGEFVLAMNVGGSQKDQKIPLHLTIVRPNKINLETATARVVSDGTTMTTVVNALKSYSDAPAPKSVTFDTVFTAGPVGSAVFGGPSAPMMMVLLNMLVGDDPGRALLDLGDTLTAPEDRELDGKECRVLTLASDQGGLAFHMLIDPETRLLRAIELNFDPKALADAFPAGQKVKIDTFRWTSGPVSVKAPADEAFAFVPPPDFAKIKPHAKAAPKDDEAGQKFQTDALVGKPAPDFTLTLLDGAGKTKTVSKADLAGKVVMIDFWATWCGPCLSELPEIQTLVEALARDKDKVVVVALSQDDDPKDLTELRKLVESTLEKKKIVLTGNPVGRIGLDPSGSVGQAFKVEGYPTVVLIDAQGIVRVAHVGYNPGIGKTLRAEIEALRDGKPVGKGKANAGK